MMKEKSLKNIFSVLLLGFLGLVTSAFAGATQHWMRS
jgi:hypothetical protein